MKGLGLKTAQKILVELSGKLDALDAGTAQAPAAAAAEEALQALVMLGFAKASAEKVLRGLAKEHAAASAEELIRMALKQL